MASYERDSGAAEPMVLIHGFSSTGRIWAPVLGRLKHSFDVIAVNLAGHVGGPEFGDSGPSVGGLADAVERDMDAAGFETAHLVGNSLGGWIAFELAKRGRARSVVGVSPAGGWEGGTRAEKRLRALFTRNHEMTRRILPRLDSMVTRPRARRLLLWQAVARGERLSPATAAQIIRDSFECPVYFELMDAITRDGPPDSLDGVSCPVLLMWGTKDRILPSPKYSQRLRDMLPDAEWVALPGLGHVPMSDDPELVAKTISEFVGEVREPTAVA